MDETKLRSIAQLQEFLDATQEISFTSAPGGGDQQRYEHKRYGRPAVLFARTYTGADVELLVKIDRANEDVCGVAIVHLLRRVYTVYGDPRYERLSKLSVSHLYNLRKSAGYQKQRIHFTQTRAVCNSIGVRKAPRLLLIRHELFMKRRKRLWGHRSIFSPAPVFVQASSCAQWQQP